MRRTKVQEEEERSERPDGLLQGHLHREKQGSLEKETRASRLLYWGGIVLWYVFWVAFIVKIAYAQAA